MSFNPLVQCQVAIGRVYSLQLDQHCRPRLFVGRHPPPPSPQRFPACGIAASSARVPQHPCRNSGCGKEVCGSNNHYQASRVRVPSIRNRRRGEDRKTAPMQFISLDLLAKQYIAENTHAQRSLSPCILLRRCISFSSIIRRTVNAAVFISV